MKKYCLAIIAVLTAFVFVFAGCGGQNGGKNNGGASVTVAPTPQIADGTGYDNSVTITDGAVNGTSFNWQFFLGKSGAGRSAEIGIAEVHQALMVNGLRDKVVLRCSGAHQTGRDVVVSALLGGDSFEFGTTALMMLRCVMAKNCNIKCPAGLTTNAEA
ncbi:MAG: hypothetical protein IIZ56_03305, partial [Clostridia bacterium]|nr:hypothetical protein [Clostridia bacterium]